MLSTRPSRTRARAKARASRLWDDIADSVPASLQQAVRSKIRAALRDQAEEDIDEFTHPSDTAGFLILLRTDIEDREDVFRVIGTSCPDYRLAMADREIPLDSLHEVARFPVKRVRTAMRLMLNRLEALPRVQKIHSHYFKTMGGANSMRETIKRVAYRVNGVPYERPLIRTAQPTALSAPRIRVRIRQPAN